MRTNSDLAAIIAGHLISCFRERVDRIKRRKRHAPFLSHRPIIFRLFLLSLIVGGFYRAPNTASRITSFVFHINAIVIASGSRMKNTSSSPLAWFRNERMRPAGSDGCGS